MQVNRPTVAAGCMVVTKKGYLGARVIVMQKRLALHWVKQGSISNTPFCPLSTELSLSAERDVR